MFTNKAPNGKNNICGDKVRALRLAMPERTSQRALADRLQLAGIDVDKNTVQRIESGERFVTDIELKIIAKALGVSCDDLLDD